jgi:hypothetical protein
MMFKFCAKFHLFLTVWIFFIPIQSILTQDKAEDDLSTDLAIKQVLVWKGEITGIYERKTQLKIQIYRNQKLPQSLPDRDALRSEILSQNWKVFQKKTKSELAVFYPRELVWEKQLRKNSENAYSAIVWGELVATDQLLLGLIVAGSYIAKFKDEKVFIEPNDYFAKKPNSPVSRIIHSKDRKEMLLVSRGLFLYGQGIDSTESSFHPQYFQPNLGNLIEVAPFYMDRYEVTNEEYNQYLKETNSNPPAHWEMGKMPEGREDHPVNFLTYKEVEGYAKWSGKRIPTEWEWEKAARGMGIEIYQNKDETLSYYIQAIQFPHGNEFDAKAMQYK